MNNSLGIISAFLGGALVGTPAALLFAPEKGEDLRARIIDLLRKKGILCTEADVDSLVEKLKEDLES